MKILYATDFHGNRKAICNFFKVATAESVDLVIVGGDLTPKKVALRLAEYEDENLCKESFEDVEEENVSKLGGEIILLDAMKKNGINGTYRDFLEQAKRFSRQQNKEKLIEAIENIGYIVHKLTNPYYEIDSMIEEQVVFEKLIRFFVSKEENINFSEMEMLCVEEIVCELAKKYENGMDEKIISFWHKKCEAAFVGDQKDKILKVLPSQYLLPCILAKLFNDEVSSFFDGTRRKLKKLSAPIDDYIWSQMRLIKEKLSTALNFRSVIDDKYLSGLIDLSTFADIANKAMSFENVLAGQENFLQSFFLPLVAEWKIKNPNKQVLVLFGNDDMVENAKIMEEASLKGIISYIHNQTVNIDTVSVYGYGNVSNLPQSVSYRSWEKSEEEIANDLEKLHENASNKFKIAVIHNPPFGVMDQMRNENVGSQSIRLFIEQRKPDLVLTGHIHEAPKIKGMVYEQLGSSLCVNPGGELASLLRAIIVDTDNLSIKIV